MGRVQIVRGVGLPEVVRRFLFLGESPLTNCNWCMGWGEIVRGVGPPEGVRRFFILGRVAWLKQKGDIPAETPQHYYHTTLPNNCQLSVCEKLRILCFTPKFRKLFVLFPVLRNALKYGRLMVRKKVIPDMVSTPAGWAFKIFRFT